MTFGALFTASLTIIGLTVFETVSSIDNAIINAHVLKKMSAKMRKLFLIFGVFFAVFLVRAFLPLLIVWLTTPGITIYQAIEATLGSDPATHKAMEDNAYILLMCGGIFLLLLYLHWLFLEKKDPYFVPDKLVRPQHKMWFFALSAVLLVGLMWAMQARPLGMLTAAFGNAIFFILYGFRQMAEEEEKKMEQSGRKDWARLLFLIVLDASFSIDGVLGAFAFTTNILLIFLGNGLGAVVVLWATFKWVEGVAKYKWLKNGAMTSIGLLGLFMILEAFDLHVPQWLPPVTTFALVGWAFLASHRYLKKIDLNPKGGVA